MDQQINRLTNRMRRRADHLGRSIIVKQVKGYLTVDNPMTQRGMARLTKVSALSINRLIHSTLKKKTFRKMEVHAIVPSAIEQRRIRALPLYHLIKNRQFEYVFCRWMRPDFYST